MSNEHANLLDWQRQMPGETQARRRPAQPCQLCGRPHDGLDLDIVVNLPSTRCIYAM